jgi:hypothetical protein
MPVPRDVRDFLRDSHPGLADLALWVREAVLAGEADLTERVYHGWDGIGFRHPDAGYVCAIYPREQEQEVRLLFAWTTPRACSREPVPRPASSACGSGTAGSLPPSVAMSMARSRSGYFDVRVLSTCLIDRAEVGGATVGPPMWVMRTVMRRRLGLAACCPGGRG